MLVAICLTALAMYLSILLNYKKYNLMKDKTTVSFFRIVIIDAIVMLLGCIYIILMNEEGYLDLTTCILPPLTMIPLIKTNKKIKLD